MILVNEPLLFLKNYEGEETTKSAFYLTSNRNKRAITVDISKPDGSRNHQKNLVLESYIVIENYKVGQLKKYGLDYENLKLLKMI